MASSTFSLEINSFINSIIIPFNAWHLDDGTIGGELEQVLRDISEIERNLSSIGLCLNPQKCEVSILGNPPLVTRQNMLSRVRLIMPGISETPIGDLTLLGSPIGVQSLDVSIQLCSRKVKLACERVEGLDSHWALFFVSRYVSAPRVNYLLRTAPVFTRASSLHHIDGIVRNTLAKCVDVDTSGATWEQATLPVRYGGLGIRSVLDLALPCYNSSLFSSQTLISEIVGNVAGQSTIELSYQHLLSSVNQVDRARLVASSLYSGA